MKYPSNIIQRFCFETTSWSMFRPLNYLVLKSDTILNWKTTLIIFIVKPPNDLYTLRVCKRAGVAGSNIINILSAPSDQYLNMLSRHGKIFQSTYLSR